MPTTNISQNAAIRENQVEGRAGRGDRHALADRLAVVCLVEFLGRDLAFALVEHLDVAAERNRGDGELGAVAVATHPQRLAEADRKAQHLDPAQPGHDEMAELVEGDQQAEGDDQPPDGTEKLVHPDISRVASVDAAAVRGSGQALSRQ